MLDLLGRLVHKSLTAPSPTAAATFSERGMVLCAGPAPSRVDSAPTPPATRSAETAEQTAPESPSSTAVMVASQVINSVHGALEERARRKLGRGSSSIKQPHLVTHRKDDRAARFRRWLARGN